MIKEYTLYLNKDKEFFFKAGGIKSLLLKVHGITTHVSPQTSGHVWVLPGTYPDGLLALEDLKTLLLANDINFKITDEAMKHRLHLENIKAVLEDKNLSPELQDFNTPENLKALNLKRPLYQHQLEVLEYMQYYPRLMVGAEQGLGKTYLGLVQMAIEKQKNPAYKAIVMCPVIVIPGWYYEALEQTNLKPFVYRGTIKQRAKLRKQVLENPDKWDFIISNYEVIASRKSREDLHFFQRLNADAIFLDEISRVRGHKSHRSTALHSMVKNIPKRVGFSGTVSVGKPLDVFMPYTILNDSIFGANFYRFKNKYCKFSPYNKHIVTGYKNLNTLKAIMDTYSIFRTKEDCVDLPERTFTKIFYSLEKEQVNLYNYVISEDELELNDVTTMFNLSVTKLTKLLQIMSGFMILSPKRDDSLCNPCPNLLDCIKSSPQVFPWHNKCTRREYAQQKGIDISRPERTYWQSKKNPKLATLKGLLEITERKVIIWAYYNKELADIMELLDSMEIKYITPAVKDCAKIFEESKDIQVFLGQISQGIGITLNSADTMIFYAASMNLEDWLQALDRNHRLGQNKNVQVYTLECRGTVEEQVYTLLESKNDVRTLLQANKVCTTCTESIKCFKVMRQPFTRGCIHYENRKRAEEIEKFKLKAIKPRYKDPNEPKEEIKNES